MSDEQLEFPVVPGKRVKKAPPNDLDFKAQYRGRNFCPGCGCDASHAIASNYQLCEEEQLRLRNDGSCVLRGEVR